MKKFIKDTEILFILSSYLGHIKVLLMASYCKKNIGFPSISPENPSFNRNKNQIKREMTSSGETGGAASIHIILCG